jgi:hypothetical protein
LSALEKAQEVDFEFFNNLEKGEVATLYLANNQFPFITWTHDRIEWDLIYGSLQFAGETHVFPVNAYLYRPRGNTVFLAGRDFCADSGENVSIENPLLYFSKPLPSQFKGKHKPLDMSDLPKGAKITEPEFDLLNDALAKARNAGFDFGDDWGLRQSMDLRVPYRRKEMTGCLDFRFWGPETTSWLRADFRGHCTIRKRKPKGWFQKPHWLVWMSDDSQRNIKDHEPGERRIRLYLGGTRILTKEDASSAMEVVDTLLEGLAILQSKYDSKEK